MFGSKVWVVSQNGKSPTVTFIQEAFDLIATLEPKIEFGSTGHICSFNWSGITTNPTSGLFPYSGEAWNSPRTSVGVSPPDFSKR